MNILGVVIDTLSPEDIQARINEFLCEEKFHRIATVNPEFLVEADRNPKFRQSLEAANLRIVDGIGIVLVGFFFGKRVKRYAGADLTAFLLAKAEKEGIGVFLAVRKDGLSSYEEIRSALKKRHPNLVVSGVDFDMRQAFEYSVQDTRYKILLCNFGAPKQEFFLDGLKNNPGSIRLAMGVGGALDFLTGKQKRAPRVVRAIGLEWLWRLFLRPRRLSRIWIATAVFPSLVITRRWRGSKEPPSM